VNEIDLMRRIEALEKRLASLETLENYMTQNYGYVGGAWQKDPIRLGYSGTVRRSWSNTTLAAGDNNVDDSAVPDGEIWVITNIAARYVGTVSGVILRPYVVIAAGTGYVLTQWDTLVSQTYYSWQGKIVLMAGDYLRIGVSSATLNDDVAAIAVGWRVDTDL
jgi:hypothetical protein